MARGSDHFRMGRGEIQEGLLETVKQEWGLAEQGKVADLTLMPHQRLPVSTSYTK